MAETKPQSKPSAKGQHLRRWRKRLLIIAAALIAIESSVLASIIHQRNIAENELTEQEILAVKDAKVIGANRELRSVKKLPPRTTFSDFLSAQGIETNTIQKIVQDTRPTYNLAMVQATRSRWSPLRREL